MTPCLRISIAAAAAALLAVAWLAPAPALAAEAVAGSPRKPLVQIAILLDTSSSMEGLIQQAKTQLWKVVNEFATAQRDGVHPDLRIALYEYGNDGLPAAGHWIRLVRPFTDDLDQVSEDLFALTTNGGLEYCGEVIERAVEDLDWSRSADDLKLVFIAGNEPFTQGPVDYRKAVQDAVHKGITVNTIHCGSEAAGVAGRWKDGAALADGSYSFIDQDRVAVDVPAPQDADLARLNGELNQTYVAYGARGAAFQERQIAQDANAAKISASTLASRATSKSGGFYRSGSWDLVDATRTGAVKLEDVPAADLPPAMRKMTPAERQTYLERKGKDRAAIQSRITTLSNSRSAYLAQKQAKRAKGSAETLDQALIKTVRTQAAKSRYTFE